MKGVKVTRRKMNKQGKREKERMTNHFKEIHDSCNRVIDRIQNIHKKDRTTKTKLEHHHHDKSSNLKNASVFLFRKENDKEGSVSTNPSERNDLRNF